MDSYISQNIILKSQPEFYIFNDISLKTIWIDSEKVYFQIFTTKTAIYRCHPERLIHCLRTFNPQFFILLYRVEGSTQASYANCYTPKPVKSNPFYLAIRS